MPGPLRRTDRPGGYGPGSGYVPQSRYRPYGRTGRAPATTTKRVRRSAPSRSGSARQVRFVAGFMRGTARQLNRGAMGAEVRQLSSGSEDTQPVGELEDRAALATIYHSLPVLNLFSNTVARGTGSQHILHPMLLTSMTQAGQADGKTTVPQHLCVSGKQYTVRNFSLRYHIDFSNMQGFGAGNFRFRVVAGYITNNAFTPGNQADFDMHASTVITKFFDATKKFGGLGVTGEMSIISDKVHQVSPTTSATSEHVYPAINGFVNFTQCKGRKNLKQSSNYPQGGNHNLIMDNSKDNHSCKLPFLFVQNLDGMQDVAEGTKTGPTMSYFWAKQFTDY